MSEKIKSVFKGMPWARLVIEGGVIVSSILLAFTIDAWWEERQDRELEKQQLVRVSAELKLNQESFQSKATVLQSAFDAAVISQSWMGVDPEPVDSDELTEIWDRVLGIGTLSVPSRAINEYLAAASQGNPEFSVIRDRLTEWSYNAEQLMHQYEILRLEHRELALHLLTNPDMPVLGNLPDWMAGVGMPKSRFPFDPMSSLDDPILESRLAYYMLRVLFVVNMLNQQIQRQDELIQLIDGTLMT